MPTADNFPTFMYHLYRNFGNLKLLEPPVPVQANTVIALPSPLVNISEINKGGNSGLNSSGSEWGQDAGSYEHGNEPSRIT